MKKWTITLGTVLLAGSMLAACSETDTKEQTQNPPEEKTQTEKDVPSTEGSKEEPANTEQTKPSVSEEETNNSVTDSEEAHTKPSADSQKQPADEVEATGIFNGVGDPHTVEIEVDGQPQAFQVAPDSEAMKTFSQMQEGTKITFTYTKEGEQLILQELKNVEKINTTEATGIFNGVGDPHTVEIEVDGQPQAFQVTPDSEAMNKLEETKEGTEITFTYKKEGEQLILQELK